MYDYCITTIHASAFVVARQVKLPDYPYAPVDMPQVAWSASGELNQYSDVRAMHASGAINHTRPAAWVREFRRHYYAAVSYLDHNVGRVLTALEENSQKDDTVVAFWGDVRAQPLSALLVASFVPTQVVIDVAGDAARLPGV